jgi:hypothetical protein
MKEKKKKKSVLQFEENTFYNQLTMVLSPVAVSLFCFIGELSPKKRNLKMT